MRLTTRHGRDLRQLAAQHHGAHFLIGQGVRCLRPGAIGAEPFRERPIAQADGAIQRPGIVVILGGSTDATLQRHGQAAGGQCGVNGGLGPVTRRIGGAGRNQLERPQLPARQEQEVGDDFAREAAFGPLRQPACRRLLPAARPGGEGNLNGQGFRREPCAPGRKLRHGGGGCHGEIHRRPGTSRFRAGDKGARIRK